MPSIAMKFLVGTIGGLISMRRGLRTLTIIAVWVMNFYFPSVIGFAAEDPSADIEELAKKAQNPIGNMISLPMQYNVTAGGAAGTVNISLGAYYNAIRPENAPVWNYRFQVMFLFPK
ncbi:MAG: hypothetical protein H6Q66_2486 [Firmicutes bacterium]|nr:hypothetical protein [Bacillota bacterium]